MPSEDAVCSPDDRALTPTATATSAAGKSIGDKGISKKASSEDLKSNDEEDKTDVSVLAAVQRLKKVADFTYGKSKFPKRKIERINLDPYSEPRNIPFWEVLLEAYEGSRGISKSLDRAVRLYRADLDVVMPAIEKAGTRWLQVALTRNLQTLDKLSHELLAPEFISRLHRDAQKYLDILNSFSKVPVTPVAKGRPAKLGHTAEQRLCALRLVQNEWLQILYNYPGGLYPGSRLYEIADSEQAAKRVILKVLDEAGKAIIEFGKSVVESPDHVWRYPPIVVAAAIELEIHDDLYFMRFLLDVAKLRSVSLLEEVFLMAGIALTAVALVATGPGAAVVLALIDLGVSGFAAYEQYERGRENDLAELASVFAQGEELTNRPTGYTSAVLHCAAALLAAFVLIKGGVELVRRSGRLARDSSRVASRGAVRLPPPSIMDLNRFWEWMDEVWKQFLALRDLDKRAIVRILRRGLARKESTRIAHLKGELLEELHSVQIRRNLGRAQTGEPLEFIPGHELSDTYGRAFGDGVIGYRKDDLFYIVEIIEAKAGQRAAKGLAISRESLSKMSRVQKRELRNEAIETLRKTHKASKAEILAKYGDEIDDMMRALNTEEAGQFVRDLERGMANVGELSVTMRRKTGVRIEIVNERPIRRATYENIQVVVSKRATKLTAVVPRDVSLVNIPRVAKTAGIKVSVRRINLSAAELEEFAEKLAAIVWQNRYRFWRNLRFIAF